MVYPSNGTVEYHLTEDGIEDPNSHIIPLEEVIFYETYHDLILPHLQRFHGIARIEYNSEIISGTWVRRNTNHTFTTNRLKDYYGRTRTEGHEQTKH